MTGTKALIGIGYAATLAGGWLAMVNITLTEGIIYGVFACLMGIIWKMLNDKINGNKRDVEKLEQAITEKLNRMDQSRDVAVQQNRETAQRIHDRIDDVMEKLADVSRQIGELRGRG